MTDPILAILIGAGQRGADVYGAYALQFPEKIQFVAVAEPDLKRRKRFATKHGIPPANQFITWEPLLERLPFGQAAFICTQDQQHTAPTVAALRAGYDVLLEKPMATKAEECRQLVTISEALERQLHIAHVLRYTNHFQTIQKIIQSGDLGEIVTVSHRENVSWWHMAHSFVRGNWRREEESAPMLLAKCCHDLDLLVWLLDDRCQYLSSVGNLFHYRAENAPEGAPQYCLEGCPVEDSCPYYAPFIYEDLLPLWRNYAKGAKGIPKLLLNTYQRAPGVIKALGAVSADARRISQYKGWPRSVVALDPTPENIHEALQNGPYGRCVYRCDNDVVDHQVVTMQFESGLSVTLTMHGHSHDEGRFTRIQGTQAELQAVFGFGGSQIEVSEHQSGEKTVYNIANADSGHGGGDNRFVTAFLKSLQTKEKALALTTARQSLESHLIAFAAEEARQGKKMVKMEDFRG